jgi:hypothetical protein
MSHLGITRLVDAKPFDLVRLARHGPVSLFVAALAKDPPWRLCLQGLCSG